MLPLYPEHSHKCQALTGLGTQDLAQGFSLTAERPVGVQRAHQYFSASQQALELFFQTIKLLLHLKFNTGPLRRARVGKRTY